jgi:peptidoglycan/LPS O-acetylase OafA/YrhL
MRRASIKRDDPAHLDILDGLRGIAILLVFWFHIWQLSWLAPVARAGPFALDFSAIVRTGFLGVDLFFFLSGFCLFYPYAQARFDGRPRPTLAHFAYRRAIKIAPSYLIALAGAFGVGYAQLTFSGNPLALARMHALFFLPSFPSEIASVSGVLWSLGVEIQFYALFPAIAWCLGRKPLLTTLCAILLASADRMYVVHLDIAAPHLLMEQLPASIDLFVSGMLAAYLFRFLNARCEGEALPRRIWTLIAFCGIAVYVTSASLIYGAANTEKSWPYPSYPLAFPLLDVSFISVTLGSLFGFGAWRRVLANPLLIFFACISYNLYLWHQMIAFEMFHHSIPAWHGAEPHADAAWQYVFTAAGSLAAIVVATVLTYGIERPLLHLKLKRKSPKSDA